MLVEQAPALTPKRRATAGCPLKDEVKRRHVINLAQLSDTDERAGVYLARWVTLTLTAAK
jgi:hypothetical protein